jgi:hypothetical protein
MFSPYHQDIQWPINQWIWELQMMHLQLKSFHKHVNDTEISASCLKYKKNSILEYINTEQF